MSHRFSSLAPATGAIVALLAMAAAAVAQTPKPTATPAPAPAAATAAAPAAAPAPTTATEGTPTTSSSQAQPTPAAQPTPTPAPTPAPVTKSEPEEPAAPVMPKLDELVNPVTAALATMDALERQFDPNKSSDGDLALQRAELDRLSADVEKAAETLKPRIDAAKVQLDKLGPAPKEDQAAESPQVAAERTRLTYTVTTLEGAMKSTELVKVRAAQLTTRIQEVRHGLFTRNLFQRSGSPVMPAIWRQIAADFDGASRQLQTVFGTWHGLILSHADAALVVALVALFAYLGLRITAGRAVSRLMPRRDALQPRPSFPRRAGAASIAAPLFAMPGVIAACVLYFGADATGLIYSHVGALADSLFNGALIMIVTSALARAILQPTRPDWRLIDLDDRPSRSLLTSTRAIAFVYAAAEFAKETIRLLILPLPFSVALSFITSLAFAALLLRVVCTRFLPAERAPSLVPEPEPRFVPPAEITLLYPRWLKVPLLAVAIGIVGAAVGGYVSLSRFAAGQVVITGSAVVAAVLLHLAIRTAERALASPDTQAGQFMSRVLGLEEAQRSLLARIASILIHALVAVLFVPALFIAWGFSYDDVAAGLKQAMFGFQIGQFRISLVRLMLAIGLFLTLLFATRLTQRWLQGTVLRADRMDPGIANSIHQGIGYAGFGLATLAAVSFGGVDITNLAILAGALSVGIGFGLQSIVNNFVSGLILLVERPIKVGDLIVLRGGGQGFVRSISVRSTEIEAFDRSSLIVPNSELISNIVTNWTHRNALARVSIKVSASYKNDPEHVLAVLHEVARSAPLAMQQPPPHISFDNLGADALEFSINVVVADVNKGGDCQTQLRAAVYKAFRDNGIEFPTVERDIYLRDLDGVKLLVARVLEERQRAKAAEAAMQAAVKPAAERPS